MNGGQAQFCTPEWLCRQSQARLPSPTPASILDPQVGEGDTINVGSWSTARFGIDIDNRLSGKVNGVNLITGHCVKAFEVMDDLYPNTRWECANSNPPFNKRWKLADGTVVDSTEWTWKTVTKRANYGYFIASHDTMLAMGIPTHSWVFHYETHDASALWKGMRDTLKIGVACWKNPSSRPAMYYGTIAAEWRHVGKVLDQERVNRPPYNIFLDERGYVKTYLSYRSELKFKLNREQIQRLHRLNDAHPLALTTEKESRDLLRSLVSSGIYTVEPAARKAIDEALNEVNALACPIMEPTDFETVAYADEEDVLTCIANVNSGGLLFTKGKSYPLTTGTYRFTEKFQRRKIHETTSGTIATGQYTALHDWTRTGTDRYILVHDDTGHPRRFMDRPVTQGMDFDEAMLWKIFAKPRVQTITDVHADLIRQNMAVMKSCEMLAGYEYYPGQRQFLARVASKPHALVAAATGCGKTLCAISLIAMKGPERALIVAPQGTMRSSESEDDGEDDGGEETMTASQWIQELNKFAPYMQIWELFSIEDYERVCSLNGGKLPPGVYVTYYEAFFKNKAMEVAPKTWDDERLSKHIVGKYGLAPLPPADDEHGKRFYCDGIGKEINGFRSIISPCMATQIGDQFDMVCLDEAHVGGNLDALITQMIIRLQPKYRYAFSATPIPNIVSNIFSLMGWLAVPSWYKGSRRNAAWPYAREELSRFNNTFLSQERDLTQEEMNRKADPTWRGTLVRNSPVISAPARLLKLLKPTMAYIDKPACNPAYHPPKIVDVRVPMGKEQAILYGHYLKRANVPGGNPRVRARCQTAWLRGICADPAGFTHGDKNAPVVTSNMNPKVITILELTRDILAQGEQVVIINSRKGITNTLHEKLIESGVSVARIDSTLPTEQHSHQANVFKSGKARTLLMGIKCAASHSFDMCKYLIIGSLEYSNGPFTQACGRIDRVNSRPGVTIYCILHRDSIEEVMHDTVAVKDDAATICLKGKRIPRDFKPVDGGDVLATAIERFDLTGSTPEWQCESKWPTLREAIRSSFKSAPLTIP